METLAVALRSEAPALSKRAFGRIYQALTFQLERDYNTSAWVKAGLAPPALLVSDFTGTARASASLTFVPNGPEVEGEAWHTEGADGSLKGFVNYDRAVATGVSPCALGSHEALELLVRGKLGDPNAYREFVDPATGDTWRLEVCDPVVDTLYEVFGEQVSDFCEPAWYGLEDGLSFSWLTCRQTVGAPHELGPRGYAEVKRAGTEAWVQVMAP